MSQYNHFCEKKLKKIKLFFDRNRTQNKSGFWDLSDKRSSEFYHNSNSLFHFTKMIIFELYNLLSFKSIYFSLS